MLTFRSKQRVKALEDRLLKLEANLRGRQSATSTPEYASHSESADTPGPPGPSGNAPELLGRTQSSIEATQTAQSSSSHNPSLPHHPLFRQIPDRLAELRAKGDTGFFKTVVPSPIQPRMAELNLLQHALPEICKEFPVLDILEFPNRARNQGFASIEGCGSASRWACVNAAITLSMHVKTANSSFEQLSRIKWGYFKNAFAVFPELILHGNDVETVQALVLMALFARDSADARTTSLLISTALRISQTLDSSLFKAGYDEGANSGASEYARRALRTAFILDAELSLCCGLSPVFVAGDLEIDPPSAEAPDGDDDEDATPSNETDIFKQRAELALLHSAVRTRLSSREALDMPDTELLSAIVKLDQSLEDWRRKLPLEVRPGVIESTLEPHCVILHLAFHNLTSMVHWAARRHSTWDAATKGSPKEQSLSMMSLSRLKVRSAAQYTLRLLKQSPFEQFAQFWYDSESLSKYIGSRDPGLIQDRRQTLCYPLSAAMTLLLSILEHPNDPEAESDAQLLRGFARQVKQMQTAGDYDLSSLLTACLGLEQLANAAIYEAQNHAELSEDAFPHDVTQVWRHPSPAYNTAY